MRPSRSCRGDRRVWWGVGALLATTLVSSPLFADFSFSEPLRVTSAQGMATQVAMGIDVTHKAWIVSVVDQQLEVVVIGPDFRHTLEIPEAVRGQGDPNIVNTSSGGAFVSFTQPDTDPHDTGREVFLARSLAGEFGAPKNVSQNRVDDSTPRMVLDSEGVPHLVWVRSFGDSTQVVYYEHATEQQAVVAEGDYPHLFVERSGTVHVVYARDNDLYYNNNASGTFDAETSVLETPTEAEFGAHLGVDGGGRVFVAYASEGSLYFTSKPIEGEFSAPRLLDAGGVLDPELRMRRGGVVSITYAKDGDLYFIQGVSAFLLEPARVWQPTPQVESQPTLVVDTSGNLHTCFLRDGEVYYTNNSGDVTAEFNAAPRIGEVPLTVRFQDLSSGSVQLWEWDFGDGTRSNAQNPEHTYTEPGPYSVSLTVFNTDKESTMEKLDFISVVEPFNTLRIPDQTVLPSQEDVWFPVIASHRDPIQGFQLHGKYDPRILTLNEIQLQYTATEDMRPEIWEANFEDEPDCEKTGERCLRKEGRFEVGSIFDFDPPFDHSTLPGGDDQVLTQLVFDVSRSAPQGAVTRIDLLNDSEVSRIFNIFTVNRFSKLPTLNGSSVRVLNFTPPFPRFFLRGDVDGNGVVEITDAVNLLNFLFLGGRAPNCLDAADFQDRGHVDISDAISVLGFLFLGGTAPRVPFPNAGIDPTEDDLPCP